MQRTWGGVNASNVPVGTLPPGISNLQYEDYSLFVGTKNISITWSGSTDGYLVYYLAEEGEPSWYQQRVYWYTKNYKYSEYNSSSGEKIDYQRRIVHLDQGPTAKEGNTYNTFYDNDPDQNDLSTDPTESDMGIGWVPSMNPFLVGRSVKWDDPTCWNDDTSNPVIKKVPLSQGSLTIENVSKSTIVFFTFQDAAGNYYAGPDKLTNSQAAANRHSPLSLLPWNECYISAHLNVPMPLKILWSTEENGTYTEVPAGTDVVFPSTAYVKFQWNDDFISAVQNSQSDFLSNGTSNYDVYYTTTSLLPLKQRPVTQQFGADFDGTESYDPDRLEAVKYDVSQDTAIVVSANTVLRFAIYPSGSSTMYLGQDDNRGNINDVLDDTGEMLQNTGNKLLKAYEKDKFYNDYGVYSNEAVSLYGATDSQDQGEQLGPIPPIYTFLRNNYLWGITFVKETATKKAVTFGRPIPYTSWSENVGGRYGLGTGTYSYQTWVSDGDYLVPSSLEGICDFFIVVQPETYWDQSVGVRDNGIYMSRINWIPKNMPVIVRYRNYSTPKPLPSNVLTAIDNNNAAAEAELENGLYFHGNCNDYDYSQAHYYSNVLKAVFSGDYDTNSSTGISESVSYSSTYDDPRTWQYSLYDNYDGSVYENENGSGKKWATPLTDAQGHRQYVYTAYEYGNYNRMYKAYENYNGTNTPLYYVWDTVNDCPALQKMDDGYNPLFYKTDYQGNALYQALDNDNNPLYQVYDDNVGNLVYYAVDSNNDKQWQEVDGSGNRLYYYHYHNVSGADYREYQQVDGDGNPLYCEKLGTEDKWCVYGYPPGSESEYSQTVPKSSVESLVASWEGYGFTNIRTEQVTTTTPNGYPLYGETVTDYPHTSIYGESNDPVITAVNTGYYAYTTDKNAYPVTTTTENAYPLGTTTVTAKRLTTTYYSNDEYSTETGYVFTRNEPVIDTDNIYDGSNNTNCAYTITDNGHPVTTTSSGTYGWYTPSNVHASISFVISPYITTDASHMDANAPEGVAYHVPLYIDPEQDPEHGTYEKKLYDFGGNYFTNIRELSNTMLTASSSANYDFNFEDHTFYLYPGDPTHCQYNKEWMMYHLSTRNNRDEANFINVLQFSDTPITVDGSATYYGFSIDHKNEFHPANTSAWATEYSDAYTGNNVYIDSSKDYIFSAGADQSSGSGALNVSLQSYSFMQRYGSLCEGTDAYGSSVSYQPVVDNWLVFAPNGGDANTGWSDRSNYYMMPYYYGYGPTDLMRKQSTIGNGDDMDTPYTDGNYKESDSFGGWTSAAWKRVTSGTIAARRPYLQLYSSGTFYDPDKVPDRNGSLIEEGSAKYSITAGGGLSLWDAIPEDDGTTTVLKHQPTVTADDGTVYDLQGRRVADDVSQLPTLAKGVYIVNGKKQVIR